MNEALRSILHETVEVFRNDPRVIGAWHFGSVARGSEDDYSDVDPVLLVTDDAFDQFDRGLPEVFQRIGPRIQLWWPESFNDNNIRNYAVLLDADGLCQYDITIVRESGLSYGLCRAFLRGCKPEGIIFDKTGLVKKVLLESGAESAPEGNTAKELLREIDKYWLFIYISVKYFKRADVFMALYARNELMFTHLNVLRMTIQEGDWSWWPKSITENLGSAQKERMLSYFGPPAIATMIGDMRKQIAGFVEEARAACRVRGAEYPWQLEKRITEYVDEHLPDGNGK